MTVWIGPVEVEVYDPVFNWGATPAPDGAREASIEGRLVWSAAQQLSELIDNPHRRVTIGRAVGVLEYVWASDDMRRPFRGWYLLSNFDISGGYEDSLEGVSGIVPVSFTAVLLGDQRQVVLARSARARANDFDLAGQVLVVNPFWGEDPDGEPFVVDPGGTFITREYDPTSPHDTEREAAADGQRWLGMQVGTADELATIVLPDLTPTSDGVPPWVTDRGGDCRAYDRREEREVFGPSHPLVAPTDLLATNGLIRYWVGNRGLPPFLNVEAFALGQWREIGCLAFAEPDSDAALQGVRLTRVTPDVIVATMTADSIGDIAVSLQRGERMLRIQHGSTRQGVSASRVVRWLGMPPHSRLESAPQGVGKFGFGLAAETADLRLRIPSAL